MQRKSKIGAAALALAALNGGGVAHAQEQTIVVANWGGKTAAATESTFGVGFAEATGITMQTADAGAEMGARVESQYSAGQVSWDLMFASDSNTVAALAEKGYIAKLPPDLLAELRAKLPASSVSEYGIANASNAHLIVCNMDVMETCPKTLAEFFDVEAFPQKRTMRGNSPIYPVSYAMAASGIALEDIGSTPVDLDLAFEYLERVKPFTPTWFTSSSQQLQVMQSGAADIGILNSRTAFQLAETGNYEVVLDDMTRSTGYTVVLEHAPHKEAAFEFIAWIADNPDVVADFILESGLSAGVPQAFDKIDEDVAVTLIDYPGYAGKFFDVNSEWFAQNTAELRDRWRDFLAN